MQNSYLAEDVVFMKNWDILTAEFKSDKVSPLYDQFPRDSELILYISYVCELKMQEIQKKFSLSGPEEILNILKSLLYKALNNYINLTKIYRPLWGKAKMESFFRNLELKNIHSNELLKTFIEIKQNPKNFLQSPEAFYYKTNYKHQYTSPPFNSPLTSRSPISKIPKHNNDLSSMETNCNTMNEEKKIIYDKESTGSGNHNNNIINNTNNKPANIFRSFRSFGNLCEANNLYNYNNYKDQPPVESFITTQDFFVSALNDRRDMESFPYNFESVEPKIRDQIDNDNKLFDEKKEQLLTQYNLLHNKKKTSNEKQQPSHKSVLLRINNEHRAEKADKNSSQNSKSRRSGSDNKSRSSSSESSSSTSHRSNKKKKKTSSKSSKPRKTHRISKKNSHYYSFSRKKSPREEFEKYLVAENNRPSGGGHYERQLLKKYKGEKLAEFIEKVSSGTKPVKDFTAYRKKL